MQEEDPKTWRMPVPTRLVDEAVDDTPARPEVVVLCGSTRFRHAFHVANRGLTLAGCIVLAPGVFGHADGLQPSEEEKTALDALHLRKIDMADRVLVVNPGGYIGESTRNEIVYAERTGKPIDYLHGIDFADAGQPHPAAVDQADEGPNPTPPALDAAGVERTAPHPAVAVAVAQLAAASETAMDDADLAVAVVPAVFRWAASALPGCGLAELAGEVERHHGTAEDFTTAGQPHPVAAARAKAAAEQLPTVGQWPGRGTLAAHADCDHGPGPVDRLTCNTQRNAQPTGQTGPGWTYDREEDDPA